MNIKALMIMNALRITLTKLIFSLHGEMGRKCLPKIARKKACHTKGHIYERGPKSSLLHSDLPRASLPDTI